MERIGAKLDALSAVIGASWGKSGVVGVTLRRDSIEGKVRITVGAGEGTTAVGLGTEI